MDIDLIDHRYFYYVGGPDGSIGKYTCGIAREAAARQLRRCGMEKFGQTDFLTALNDYIDNPSAIGFFIEQAILSSIAAHGLKIGQNIEDTMTVDMFAQKFPRFDTNATNSVLHCPLDFNYRGIDGIIVRFVSTDEKKTCFLFPIQITVAKTHSNSEEAFFSEWQSWTKNLEGYEVVPRFLWITTKNSLSEEVAENCRKARSGDKVLWPHYNREFIHLEKVSKDIWQRYQKALTLGGRKEFNIEVESASEEQDKEGEKGTGEQVRIEEQPAVAESKGGGAKRGGGTRKGGKKK
jgi:hypothetical protein